MKMDSPRALLRMPAPWAFITILAIIPLPAASQALRGCGQSSITLSLPEDYESVKVSTPSVLCAFRHSSGGFPTVNVVRDPLPFERLNGRPGAERVLESYTTVGLTDVKVVGDGASHFDGREVRRLDLRYTNSGAGFLSTVLIMPETGGHLIITIVRPESLPTREVNQLIERLEGAAIADAPPVSSQPLMLVGGLLAFVAVLAAVQRLVARRTTAK